MSVQIQLRRDTAANWTSANPTLALAEIGYETNTGKYKFGDGSTAWASLAYSNGDLHIVDTSAAHTAASISFTPNGSIAATDVQAAIQEVRDEAGGSGAVATDVIWDVKGDLALGTGANTAARLAAGANDTILMADSGQSTGAKWGNAATVKTALAIAQADVSGLTTASSPLFTGVDIGNADTSVTRFGAGDLSVEGNRVFRVGGTDVPIADGGTGASTAAAARSGLDLITRTIFLSSAGMWPRTTNPAAGPTLVEMSTNKENVYVLDFDGTTAEYAQCQMVMPADWDAGTVTAIFYWTVNASVSTSVTWGIRGVSLGDNEAIDATLGTEIFVTDAAQSGAHELYKTASTAAITITGATAGELVVFQIRRDPSGSNGTDDMTQDARLIGALITYTRT